MKKHIALLTVFFLTVVMMGSLISDEAHAMKVENGVLKLQLSHQYPDNPKDYRVFLVKEYIRLVEEKSNGKIQITEYPAQSLYKAKAAPVACMQGTLDMCLLPMIYLAGKVPSLNITLFPTLCRSRDEMLAWRGKEIDKFIKEDLLKHKLVELPTTIAGSAIGSTVKQIKVPSDTKGLKVRVPGKYTQKMFLAQGAGLVTMSSAEVYTGLQRGLIDVCSVGPGSFVSFRFYELLKYYNPYPLYTNTVSILMGKPAWDKLTDEQKQIFLDCEKEAEDLAAPVANATDTNAIKIFKENGVNVHEPTLEEFQEWEAASTPSRDAFIKDYPDAKKLFELADKANKEYRASHQSKQ